MANLPKFYRSNAGMRYFVVNGRKVFIEPGVSKKQILSIYKTLKKTIKIKKRKPKTKQSAQTVININNEPKRRNRSNRNRKYVKFGSTINPLIQSVSSGFTKDSGDIDLVNKSINEFNKKLDDDKRKLQEETKNQNFVVPYQGRNPVIPIDYTRRGRMNALSRHDLVLQANRENRSLTDAEGQHL